MITVNIYKNKPIRYLYAQCKFSNSDASVAKNYMEYYKAQSDTECEVVEE